MPLNMRSSGRDYVDMVEAIKDPALWYVEPTVFTYFQDEGLCEILRSMVDIYT